MVQRTTVYSEGVHNAEWLISLADRELSVDQVDIAQDAAVYESGTVMMGALDAANTRWDGASAAAISGILYLGVDAISAADRGVVVNQDAQANESYLVFASSVDAAAQTAAIAQLRTMGIKTRESSK